MYFAYLPAEKFKYSLKMNVDDRGFIFPRIDKKNATMVFLLHGFL